MKKCKDCKVEKKTSEFYKVHNKYLMSYCKECHYIRTKNNDRRATVKRWREQQHNGTWKVYMLPNSKNYVGYTKAILPRMYRHKQQGNNTSDYRVLMECNTENDAKELEALLHDIGFRGRKK